MSFLIDPFICFPNTGPTDPNFASVSLLCHFNGANGDQTSTDSSSFVNSLNFGGTTKPQISTSQFKFGVSSLDLTGANGTGRVWLSDSAQFDFGNGKFTLEGWVRYSTAPGSNVYAMVAQWPTSSTMSWFLGNVSGSIALYYSTTGSNTFNVGASWTPTTNTWYHLAADRDASNVIRVYVDGVVKASATDSATFYNSANEVSLGNSVISASAPLPGFIDEVRVTKGVARYAGAFTPPTAAFPNS